MRVYCRRFMAAVVVAVAAASSARGVTIQFQETDAGYQAGAVTMRSTASQAMGNDGGNGFQIGRTATEGDFLRGFLSFDISSIPAGSTIESATLTLTSRSNDATNPGQNFTIELRELVGAASETQVIWLNRDFAGPTPWATPGGDIQATALSSILANPATIDTPDASAYVFATSSAFVAAAQAAVDGAGTLHMIAVSPDGEAHGSRVVFTFASDDPGGSGASQVFEANAPLLTIEYSPVPEPASTGLAVATLSLVALRWRRSRVKGTV